MGSGTKRRGSDHVLIVPQEKRSTGKGGAGISEGSLVCPASFRVSIAEKVAVGAPLQLRKEDDGLSVYFGGKKVGEVEKALAQTITLCVAAGYRYEGVVEESKEKLYGKFEQKL